MCLHKNLDKYEVPLFIIISNVNTTFTEIKFFFRSLKMPVSKRKMYIKEKIIGIRDIEGNMKGNNDIGN